MTKGYLLLLSGYLGWGIFPLYWNLLAHVDAVEVTLHRIIWSVPVLLVLVLLVQRRQNGVRTALQNQRVLIILVFTALLITLNWGVYVWAVANERVLEASMGYFLSPLLTISAGVLMFRERLKALQWFAVICAALGVSYYMLALNTIPWVALTVGMSFSLYGVLRKQVAVDAVPGLFIETLLLAPLTILGIFWRENLGLASFSHGPILDDMWMILGGAVTVIPLVLFTAGARLLPMATVGILFFLTPTLQFLAGVLILHEPLDTNKLLGFSGIWLGLVFYCIALLQSRNQQTSALVRK